MERKLYFAITFVALIVQISGCSGQDGATPKVTEPQAPMVTDQSTNLLLSWFEDKTPKTGFSPTEVPGEHRKEVRVQDLNLPPEKRDTNWVFLANLNRPREDGTYPVKTVLREKWERGRQRQEPPLADTQANATATPISADAPVIMYATKHCPACKKARRWLLASKIPYIEKDIESDAHAAAAVAQKGKAQGVPTSGVPIFDIGGKLVPGFDPDAITKLLRGLNGHGGARNI